MTKLKWGSPGDRQYEIGVDKGVLYTEGAGISWNGLVSVNETPSGGEVREFFYDGFKYANYVSSQDFSASVEAFTYPEEFARCDGTASVKNGLFITQQRRRPFGFSYRTQIGNDISGVDFAYKIHLVYNAYALPSAHANGTLDESNDASMFTWTLTTRPPAISGYKPTSHFVIDSRKTPRYLMYVIESILYGDSGANARLPLIQELVDIFNTYVPPEFFDGGLADNTISILAGGVPETVAEYVDGGEPLEY